MRQLIICLIAFFKSEHDRAQIPHESLLDEGLTHTEWLQSLSRSHIRYLTRRLSYWKRKPKKTIHRRPPQAIIKMP